MKKNNFFYAKNDRFLCANLSVIGQKNWDTKKECQDYSLSATYNAPNACAALSVVCDGHGSDACHKSQFGAKIAAEITAEITKNYMEKNKNFLGNIDQVLQEIINQWSSRVREFDAQVFSSEAQDLLKQYGTTLCFALALNDSLCVAQLGDGAVALLPNQRLHLPNTKKVDGLTSSLCQLDAQDRFDYKIYDLSDIDFVLLCSDGIFDLYETDHDFLEFVNTMYSLDWASFDQNKTQTVLNSVLDELGDCGFDDMSIAFILRTGE